MSNLKGRVIAALAAGAFVVSTAATAETLKLATGFPPGSVAAESAELLAKKTEEFTNGDLKIKVFPLSLLNLKETPPGLRDGIADLGYVLPPYYPAEYANTNLAADLNMVSTLADDQSGAPAAVAGAMSEYVFFECPDCQKEWRQQNQVYLGTGASGIYVLHCNTPVVTLEQARGKKYRSGGANFGRWAEAVGGIKVSMPGNDIYSAMEQGVLDCGMFSTAELSNLQLFDVTSHITMRVPGGLFAGVALNNANRDAWQDLSESGRRALLDASAYSTAYFTYEYVQRGYRNVEKGKGMGIEVHEPSPELLETSREFARNDVATIVETFKNDYGVDNAEAKVAKFRELLAKWEKLTAGKGDDLEALTKLYADEIYSKVDASTYGMD
ncbi:C4-dicarboxylate TRAP transporter substrate-binding protein [Minwuia thermotolerans]|uniref:C4-dicarboxylate ABC transporter substrate-binding protein n=1 Tax=Minwuia thermotolerans TaxID=2056226 RepID=A0A2M9G5L1_9PROT|nr:C4-dicarboxylate TRAP transporter substrate-binding protein [Minwuia thermotolerans]PJK31003.1 C4-dicarboxylate ABC transporter substrate-binding protein [Minwuia thermotolerans]